MENENLKKKSFDPQESISRAKTYRISKPKWHILSEGNEYIWTSKLERVSIIRKGIPYESIEGISKRINLPIKEVLYLFGIPQTTYNKFQRWLKKPNYALGGYTPESLLDSTTGIQEVKNCLNRLEHGSFA